MVKMFYDHASLKWNARLSLIYGYRKVTKIACTFLHYFKITLISADEVQFIVAFAFQISLRVLFPHLGRNRPSAD